MGEFMTGNDSACNVGGILADLLGDKNAINPKRVLV